MIACLCGGVLEVGIIAAVCAFCAKVYRKVRGKKVV